MTRDKYIFKRKGSQNWWLRLQLPTGDGKWGKTERSLGTPDREEALIRAFDDVKAHKLALLTLRKRRAGLLVARKPMQVGDHTLEDGTRIHVTEKSRVYFDASGAFLRQESNGLEVSMKLTNGEAREFKPFVRNRSMKDDQIIRTWIKQRGVSKHLEREAWSAWELFKRTIDGKPLDKCSVEDGRRFAELLIRSGNKSKTVEKKIGHLRAAVNLAINDGMKIGNPFASAIVPRCNDGVTRLPLNDDDMRRVRESLGELREGDQLLWIWLATTGMRLDEPFQVSEEHREDGIRFVLIGTKSEPSRRRVPIPEAALPLLPSRISGPLFHEASETVGKRLRYFLKKLEISYDARTGKGDKRKVLHSLRHRAKDRLRAEECPLEIQYEILGHEERTVASGYGVGSPVPKLKAWVDKIGW